MDTSQRLGNGCGYGYGERRQQWRSMERGRETEEGEEHGEIVRGPEGLRVDVQGIQSDVGRRWKAGGGRGAWA